MSKIKALLVVFLSVGCFIGSAFAVTWLTAVPFDAGSEQGSYVVWSATANSSLTASATTSKPILGELREIMYVPDTTTALAPTTNTATLTVKNGWATPSNVSVDAFTSSDLNFSGTFGSATASELYKDTAELVCRGYPYFQVTNAVTPSGEPATFRLVFVFGPEPNGLPAE
jgi:hypothetical protein